MTNLYARLIRTLWYWSFLLFVAVLITGVSVVLSSLDPTRTILIYTPVTLATLALLVDRLWGTYGTSNLLDAESNALINELLQGHPAVLGSLTVIAVFVTLFGL